MLRRIPVMRCRPRCQSILTRIPRMNWAGRTEDRGNAGETSGSFFHPSGPSESGHLVQRKNLISQRKLARVAGRTPFHPVNPGQVPDKLRAKPAEDRIQAADVM